MSKITYLFGAGASCKALPIVKGIPDRLQHLISLLESEQMLLSNEEHFLDISDIEKKPQNTKQKYQIDLIDNLRWLQQESKRHASIDTFAKKLTIKGDTDELEKLKIGLSVFFTFEQVQNPIDPRYDTFFASILNSDKKLPNNMRILSWNYDYQFEIALSEYINFQNEITAAKSFLRENSKNRQYIGGDEFGMFKLNGTTHFYDYYGNIKAYSNSFKREIDSDLIEEITRNYAFIKEPHGCKSALSFAWEPDEQQNIQYTINETVETKILVIIGYSFPFFNREIDKKLFESMNIQKVYVQDPNANAIIERFKATKGLVRGIDFISIDDTEQFFLPHELEL
jgi:hypothetical protein